MKHTGYVVMLLDLITIHYVDFKIVKTVTRFYCMYSKGI